MRVEPQRAGRLLWKALSEGVQEKEPDLHLRARDWKRTRTGLRTELRAG